MGGGARAARRGRLGAPHRRRARKEGGEQCSWDRARVEKASSKVVERPRLARSEGAGRLISHRRPARAARDHTRERADRQIHARRRIVFEAVTVPRSARRRARRVVDDASDACPNLAPRATTRRRGHPRWAATAHGLRARPRQNMIELERAVSSAMASSGSPAVQAARAQFILPARECKGASGPSGCVIPQKNSVSKKRYLHLLLCEKYYMYLLGPLSHLQMRRK